MRPLREMNEQCASNAQVRAASCACVPLQPLTVLCVSLERALGIHTVTPELLGVSRRPTESGDAAAFRCAERAKKPRKVSRVLADFDLHRALACIRSPKVVTASFILAVPDHSTGNGPDHVHPSGEGGRGGKGGVAGGQDQDQDQDKQDCSHPTLPPLKTRPVQAARATHQGRSRARRLVHRVVTIPRRLRRLPALLSKRRVHHLAT